VSRLAYRKDIDGLRALAVLLVFAYHYGVTTISGGYIGVDLFFVISGFLIASLLDQESRITPAAMGGFYRRRIQRLLPAFIAVAIVTTIVASVLLLPEDYDAYLKSIRESFLFRSNVYFARVTTGYFAANAAELPWLHTWSLAIEWQFYFVYPLAIWAVRRQPSRSAQTLVLCGLTLIGLALSITLTFDQPAQAYFSAIARFFEFLLGALVTRFEAPVFGRRFALVISTLCVAGLLLAAGSFVRETAFPGVNAALVCLLGFTLIVVGKSSSILDFDAAAFIGRRSYSIYLWHWPIIAYLRYLQIQPSDLEIVALTILVFALSDITYRWVERPGIAARWTLRRAFVACCVMPLFATAGLYLIVEKNDGFPQRLGPEAIHAYANLQRFDSIQADRCHGYLADDLEPCAFGDLAAPRTALLIGDSHARHFRPFVQILAQDAHVKVYGLTSSECLALEGVALIEQYASRQECSDAIARDFRLIDHHRYDYVMIAERWIGYPADQVDKLDRTLRTIVASGAIPILFKPIAEDGGSPKDCFYLHIKLRRAATESCAIAADNAFFLQKKQHVESLIDAMKVRYRTLRVIDPKSVQCAHNVCTTVIDATPIYSDTVHLDPYGSAMLGRDYLARFGNPLRP